MKMETYYNGCRIANAILAAIAWSYSLKRIYPAVFWWTGVWLVSMAILFAIGHKIYPKENA